VPAKGCPDCGLRFQWIPVEHPEVFDGILIWQCQVCGHRWPRFATGRLHEAALRILREDPPDPADPQ
jgi:hypothetical protein